MRAFPNSPPLHTLKYEVMRKTIPGGNFFGVLDGLCTFNISSKERYFQGITREIRVFFCTSNYFRVEFLVITYVRGCWAVPGVLWKTPPEQWELWEGTTLKPYYFNSFFRCTESFLEALPNQRFQAKRRDRTLHTKIITEFILSRSTSVSAIFFLCLDKYLCNSDGLCSLYIKSLKSASVI